MKERICITGASGFIGSRAVAYFLERGYEVAGISRNLALPSQLKGLQSKIAWYVHDLSESAPEKALNDFKPTVILHFAADGVNEHAQRNIQDIGRNFSSTLFLMEAIKKRLEILVIHSGSSSEYGIHDVPMQESSELRPINDYGVSKAGVTLYCQKLFLREHIPVHTFRLFSPYGYGEHAHRFIPYVIRQALLGESIEASNPEYVRDFIFVDDVMAAYERAIKKRVLNYPIYNLGSGKEYSLREVVSEILHITKSVSKVEWNALPKQERQIEPEHWCADISRISAELKWEPEHTLQSGLTAYIDWMKELIRK